jgi:hypothetical protein
MPETTLQISLSIQIRDTVQTQNPQKDRAAAVISTRISKSSTGPINIIPPTTITRMCPTNSARVVNPVANVNAEW